MKYRYSARTKNGELQVGYVEAANRDTATSILNGHNLFVLSLEETVAPVWYRQLLGIFNRVRRRDLVIFTRQLAVMMEAAISLGDALKSLYRQTRNKVLKEAVFEISSDVDSGLSLSQALGKQPHIFSNFYINLIKSAEVTGQVEEATSFLADHLEREQALATKVRNALIYPVFVIVLFFVITGVLLGVVFPQLEPIFSEAGVDLPVVSQIFLTVGNFISNWWLAILVALVVVVLLLVDYFRSDEGRVVLDEILLRLPVIGKLFRRVYVARFAEAISVLVKGGVPIAQAIEISSQTVGSFIYRDALREVAVKVRQGELFSQALEGNETYFPPLVSQMTAVGEKTGRLDKMLAKVYDFYSQEINGLVESLVELIQPILILFIGALVGLLFASILLPIYNLVQVF